MASIPSTVALTTIADGSSIVAADHRNNYSAIQTFINALQAILAGGAAGQKLQSDGATAMSWQYPPGYEIDHATASSDVSVTGTSSASPTTVVTGNSVSYDGTAVWVEVAFAAWQKGTTAIQMGIYVDGSIQSEVTYTKVAGELPGGRFRTRVTPSAGSHTFSAKAWVDAGTGHVYATTLEPIHLTVTKV